MKQVGIDLGSSSLKLVIIEDNKIIDYKIVKHYGKVKNALKRLLEKLDLKEVKLGISGVNKKLILESNKNLKEVEDIPSIIEGVKFVNHKVGSIIEIGSENARFITDLNDSTPKFSMNEHCASGTGSFFEDQMSRLNLKIEDYSSLVAKASTIPTLSGRCAVFAKTDIIHRQQEGVKKEDILLGLCYAMIRNFKSTIVKNLKVNTPLVIGGGITLNSGVIRAIKDIFKLKDEDLIVSEYARFYQAIGTCLMANNIVNLEEVKNSLNTSNKLYKKGNLARLELVEGTNLKDPSCTKTLINNEAYLGLDIGSTSTNLVLLDKDNNLIDFLYLRTAGDPEKVVREGMKYLKDTYGDFKVLGVGITGSGRVRLGRLMQADAIVDEITCQAKAASSLYPDVDTVFEIGGQDSKFISIKNKEVVDFEMNKICAAGTGSFIEEQASRMQIKISDFGSIALKSTSPIDLGERCTVFINSAITEAEANNVSEEDIAAGLCYSIVKNYLHKVVSNKKVGKRIVLQGGVNYNPGIVAAFQSEYGKDIVVSKVFSISGAYGASIIAKERLKGNKSSFLGFDFPTKLIDNTFNNNEVSQNKAFFKQAGKIMSGNYVEEIDPNKKTIGIPLSLVMFKFFPLANEFFRNLGYNVILSHPSNNETVELARTYAHGETCYPVKLLYGHMKELANRKVDYIFLPRIHTIRHPHANAAHNYACPYMQMAAQIVFNDLDLAKEGIELIDPILDLDLGIQMMGKAMLEAGKQLGFNKARCLPGLIKGASAVKKNSSDVEKMGQDLLASLKPSDKVLVLITRNYGISDPILNMGIPKILLDRGYKVITLGHLPAMDLDLKEDYPNMYWPFGEHILSGAKIIKNHPNLYAVYLTNHGCGPDTMISHLLKEEMGDKPYLQIEVDEHYSPVGVITRVEAFLNSLENQAIIEKPSNFNILDVKLKKTNIVKVPLKDKKLFIPDLGLYTPFILAYYKELGYDAAKMEVSSKTLSLGKKEMNTKEYYTFQSLVGSAIKTCEDNDANIQILLPYSYGADSDGQYPRVLRSILDNLGYKDVVIVSPILEEEAKYALNYDLLMRALLAGDIMYNLDPVDRFEMNYIPSVEELKALAKLVNSSHDKVLNVVGSPLCITSLDEGVLGLLEEEGYHLKRMPLSEMLWFLFNDNKFSVTNDLIKEVTASLTDSSFSSDVNELFEIADHKLEGFAGNNGRYRYSKMVQMAKLAPVILVVPRYENTEMVLNLCSLNSLVKSSVYELSLDGDFDENSLSSLKSFLYYAK